MHYQLLPEGRKIDTDVSGLKGRGMLIQEGPRQLSQKEFNRMQRIAEKMDIIKEIGGTAHLPNSEHFANQFLAMDGKFSIVSESVIKNRGGLTEQWADNVEVAIKKRLTHFPMINVARSWKD